MASYKLRFLTWYTGSSCSSPIRILVQSFDSVSEAESASGELWFEESHWVNFISFDLQKFCVVLRWHLSLKIYTEVTFCVLFVAGTQFSGSSRTRLSKKKFFRRQNKTKYYSKCLNLSYLFVLY